jgi:hypothetical protein
MDLKEVGWRGMDWIVLAQDRDSWRVLLNAARIFGFRKMRGISRLGEDLLASQEGFCSMELLRSKCVRWMYSYFHTTQANYQLHVLAVLSSGSEHPFPLRAHYPMDGLGQGSGPVWTW